MNNTLSAGGGEAEIEVKMVLGDMYEKLLEKMSELGAEEVFYGQFDTDKFTPQKTTNKEWEPQKAEVLPTYKSLRVETTKQYVNLVGTTHEGKEMRVRFSASKTHTKQQIAQTLQGLIENVLKLSPEKKTGGKGHKNPSYGVTMPQKQEEHGNKQSLRIRKYTRETPQAGKPDTEVRITGKVKYKHDASHHSNQEWAYNFDHKEEYELTVAKDQKNALYALLQGCGYEHKATPIRKRRSFGIPLPSGNTGYVEFDHYEADGLKYVEFATTNENDLVALLTHLDIDPKSEYLSRMSSGSVLAAWRLRLLMTAEAMGILGTADSPGYSKRLERAHAELKGKEAPVLITQAVAKEVQEKAAQALKAQKPNTDIRDLQTNTSR